jgi:hypothetical protein
VFSWLKFIVRPADKHAQRRPLCLCVIKHTLCGGIRLS